MHSVICTIHLRILALCYWNIYCTTFLYRYCHATIFLCHLANIKPCLYTMWAKIGGRIYLMAKHFDIWWFQSIQMIFYFAFSWGFNFHKNWNLWKYTKKVFWNLVEKILFDLIFISFVCLTWYFNIHIGIVLTFLSLRAKHIRKTLKTLTF